MTPEALADLNRNRARNRAAAQTQGRFLTAIAGPPGSGKSTFAAAVVAALGPGARMVPMDGFHYDDAVLNARGMRARKGAPDPFDAAGFIHLIHRLREGEGVAIPVFDRHMELSRAAADIVTTDDRLLIVEGNYLLLDDGPWAALDGAFDLTIWIDVPEAELDRRLLERWAQHGKTPKAARDWIDGNDMPNIRRTIAGSRTADLVIRP